MLSSVWIYPVVSEDIQQFDEIWYAYILWKEHNKTD